jgi:serine/threonine protein kinase/sugar lactone lactonase YvrE
VQPGDPQRIGPYRLVRELGSGGMGRVFLARSSGGRPVAVKVIRPDLAADPEFRARFRHEVAAARLVNGLYTALVVDADTEGQVPWLATAYVAGPSLADQVRLAGPLPAGAVSALAAGLAEGLGAIHAAGLVHRDLKPSNVLLAEDGPRVIDFGISRAVEASALVVGSPGFMSPEQATGAAVGPPSDVFSLGAVLTFASTGHGPFGTGSAPALGYRVVHAPADLADVPAEIKSLVERCLAKDPGDRPAIGDLLAELGDFDVSEDWLSPALPSQSAPHAPAGPIEFPAAPPAPAAQAPTVEAQPHPAPEPTESRITPVPPVPAAIAPRQRPPARTRFRFRDFARTPLGAVILSVPLAVIIAVGVLVAFPGHASPIATLTDPGGSANPDFSDLSSLAIAGDGTMLAAGSGNRSTYLWNLKTRKITATLTGPNAADVNAVAFSPNGATLAVGDANGTTTLWDTATGTLTRTLTGPATGFQVQSVAFSPDGTMVAAAGTGDTCLWNTATGALIATLSTGEALSFSPDGTMLAILGAHNTVGLWNVATHKITATLTDTDAFNLESVAFSPNGTTLAAGDQSGDVYLWNVATRQVTATLTVPGDYSVDALAFSPGGATLAIADNTGSNYLWNVATRKVIATFNPGNKIPAGGMAFDPDGTTLATSGGNDDIYLWKLPPHTS